MKGISRKIDELGRIVIPKEMRSNLNIRENDELQIYVDDKKIILEKYSKLNNLKDLIDIIIKRIKEITSIEIMITDKENIINSNTKISKELLEIINQNTDIINKKINISENKELNCNINIIRENYMPVGSVIIPISDDKNFDNALALLISEILGNYLAL